ncbi:unnamed protein product [Amoebophrya sp. A25]|nr:unnamed protein product [Amoebophrya sp. A25]|eukprot:GSA25T00019601001.1
MNESGPSFVVEHQGARTEWKRKPIISRQQRIRKEKIMGGREELNKSRSLSPTSRSLSTLSTLGFRHTPMRCGEFRGSE